MRLEPSGTATILRDAHFVALLEDEGGEVWRIKQMKLASYIANGKPAFGVVVGDGVVTMNDRLGGRYATLARRDRGRRARRDAPRGAGRAARPEARGLAASCRHPQSREDHVRRHQLQIPRRRARHRGARSCPNIFLRFVNTLVPHEGEMIRPKVSTNFDFEGELALVIGKAGRHIKREDALELHRRLHLLLRRHRARLHQILACCQQELRRLRPARPLDRDRGRNPRSRPSSR